MSILKSLLKVIFTASMLHSPGEANCSNGETRLVGGSTDREGRVEVCVDGRWGTVCNNNPKVARVVCSQTRDPHRITARSVDPETVPIASCTVDKRGTLNCSLITDGSCDHSMDLRIECVTYKQLSEEHNKDYNLAESRPKIGLRTLDDVYYPKRITIRENLLIVLVVLVIATLVGWIGWIVTCVLLCTRCKRRRYPRVSTDENGRYYRQFDNIMYHKYQPTSQKPACTRSRTYSVIHSSLETIATTQVRPAIPIPTRDEASEGEHDARPHSYCVVNVDDPLMRPNTELGTGGREPPMYAVATADRENLIRGGKVDHSQ